MSDFINVLESLSKEYFTKLKYENKSINTINSYKNIIDSFIDFLNTTQISSFKDFKPSIIYNFLEFKEYSMNKQGELKPGTKKLYIVVLKSFFKFIENEKADELLSFDKLFSNIKIKTKKREPKGLSKQEQKKLLDYLEKIKATQNDYVAFRNVLIIKIVLFSGLRTSEILSLKYKDFIPLEDDGLYQVTVTGKGDKRRTVYIYKGKIDDEIEELLLKYKNDDDYICLSSNNKILCRQNLYKMVTSLCPQAGIKGVGLHTLRHTFAKNFLNDRGNITHLQRLLGHSNIETTMVYANPHQEDIKNGFLRKKSA